MLIVECLGQIISNGASLIQLGITTSFASNQKSDSLLGLLALHEIRVRPGVDGLHRLIDFAQFINVSQETG